MPKLSFGHGSDKMDRRCITDVRRVFEFIANDAPFRAATFIEELIHSIDRLESFPLSGRIIPEINIPDYREVIFRNYRIMYTIRNSVIEVLRVVHSARLFDETTFN